MIIDIHTHNNSAQNYIAIKNLTFNDAEKLFSTQTEGLYSIGFHPWCTQQLSEEKLKKIESWAKDKRLFAIGECGLDKNSKSSIETQLTVFQKQIELSEKINKPLIIHCVHCFNELIEVKKYLNPKQLWIIHGFRGKPQLAKQLINAGCSISFGEHFNLESVLETPINNLFIETDESQKSIIEIYEQIATLKTCNTEDLSAGENLFKTHNNQWKH